MTSPNAEIIRDGLWNNNPAFVQVLGLCPLLGVTSNAINGLGLGLATLLVVVCTNVAISLIRKLVRPEIRVPVYVLVIACVVTAVELVIHAYFYELHHILGIFIPLIVTNCVIMARAEAFASKNNVTRSFLDGLAMGLGSCAVLVTLGGMRELVGQGTLFDQAHLMLGDAGHWLTITLVQDYGGFLLAILPPGAFIGLGLLIAAKNVIDARRKQRAVRAQPAVQTSL